MDSGGDSAQRDERRRSAFKVPGSTLVPFAARATFTLFLDRGGRVLLKSVYAIGCVTARIGFWWATPRQARQQRHAPLGPGYLGDGRVYVEGAAPVPDEQRPVVFYDKVGPQYFQTMGTPLMLERDFTEQDRFDAPRVAIINQTFAGTFWPGQSG
jgi:hypothetical protein